MTASKKSIQNNLLSCIVEVTVDQTIPYSFYAFLLIKLIFSCSSWINKRRNNKELNKFKHQKLRIN